MTKEEAPQVRLNTRVVVGVQLFTLALLFLLAGSSGQLREIACSRKLGPQQEQGALFPSLDFCQHPAWGAVKAQLTTLPALPAPAPSQQQPQPQQEPQQEQQQQRLEREEVTPSQEDGTLAMCLAAKDEHCDIREWVLHHASLGTSKFYIFDTGSEPPMREALADLVATGLVEYSFVTNSTEELALAVPKPGFSYNWQGAVYPLCMRRYGARHKWMGFIDADEFIMLEPGVPSLPALLQNYSEFGGLALHWRFFSSGGHILRPAGGVLASYTACCTAFGSRSVKSIVQPEWVDTLASVHTWRYHSDRFAVNTDRRPVNPDRPRGENEASYKGATLHHYITRSLSDFNGKIGKGAGDGGRKGLGDFLEYTRRCTSVCTEAVPLGEALQQRYDLALGVPERCRPGQ